jgi:hypothetical protein
VREFTILGSRFQLSHDLRPARVEVDVRPRRFYLDVAEGAFATAS